MELVVGAVDKNDLSKINKNLNPIPNILIDKEITITAIELLQTYSISHSLKLADAIIAATSFAGAFELYTYNKKDYRFIRGIKLFKS